MVLSFLTQFFDYIMLLLIICNLMLRKYRNTTRKRLAFILWACDILLVYFLLVCISHWGLSPKMEWVAVGIGAVIAVVFIKHFLPFRLRCTRCGKALSFREIFTRDDNVCDDCWYKDHPEEKKEREAQEKKKRNPQEYRNEMAIENFASASSISDIDWGLWEPTERCVLTYVRDGEKLLMIEKKRGLGNGYFNAPGGHIELEETSREAAIRETEEETGLVVSGLKQMGTLHFQFRDGLRMIGYVFQADQWEGELKECEETRPFWTNIQDLDYSRMWADDPYWLPMMLEGKKFDGYFLFDDRTLVDHKVEEEEDD